MKPEVRYHPEGAAVDAPGMWHEGHASYPGRPADLPLAADVLPASPGAGMGRQESADAVVAGPSGEGLNMECRTEAGLSMIRTDAEDGVGMLLPKLGVAAGSREGRSWVHQTPRQDRYPLDRRRMSD